MKFIWCEVELGPIQSMDNKFLVLCCLMVALMVLVCVKARKIDETPPTSSLSKKFTYDTIYLYCPTDQDEYLIKKFYRKDMFLRIITVSENELTIYVRHFTNDYLLFWYSNDFMHDSEVLGYISCMDGPKTETRRITVHEYFLPNKIYIFCIADKQNLQIYPLNCVAYQRLVKEEHQQQQPNETVGETQCRMSELPDNLKVQIIGGMITVYVICVCAGAVLVYAIHRKIKEILKKNVVCEMKRDQSVWSISN